MNLPKKYFFGAIVLLFLGTSDSLKYAHVALSGDVPFYARIEFGYLENTTLSETTVCGATILEDSWVLTMASCVGTHKIPEQPIVRVYHGYGITTVYAIQARVTAIYFHARFLTNRKNFDIALLKTDIFLDNTRTKAAKLPWHLEEREHSTAMIAGTGRSEHKQEATTELRVTEVNLPDQTHDCLTFKKSKRKSLSNNYQKKFICVGNRGQYPIPCRGDEGGPLVSIRKSGAYVLLGMIPKNDCSKPAKKGGLYFWRIGRYWSWIKGVMDKYTNETEETGSYTVAYQKQATKPPEEDEEEEETETMSEEDEQDE